MSSRRLPLWLPYLQEAKLTGAGKRIRWVYKGGECEYDIASLSGVMLYGAACDLSWELIEALTRRGVPLLFHRRNVYSPVWVHAGGRGDDNDLLSKQIATRLNEHKRRHIARELIKAKFKGMAWLVGTNYPRLSQKMSLAEIRVEEAGWSKVYWSEYFKRLGKERQGRRSISEEKTVLDAVSKFGAGLMLRWVIYHHLSPFHGFLHTASGYPSLVYDLMEPYRPYFEKWTMEVLQDNSIAVENKLGASIERVKENLSKNVYTGNTRQIVNFHELTHGIVLALRAYLLGEAARFMPPVPDKPNGGRPRKAGYKLYGRTAGRSNFWDEAARMAAGL